MNVILGFITSMFSRERLPFTLGLMVLILLIFNLKTCNSLFDEKEARKEDARINDNNLRASTDSLKVVYDKKLDQFITQKTSYMVRGISDLKKYNESLYNEFKDVKNMVSGIKTDVSVIVPSITKEIGKYNKDPKDSTKFTIPFTFPYADSGLIQNIEGYTSFKIKDNKPTLPINATLEKNTFSIKIKLDVKEENNKYIVEATSPSKLVMFNKLESVVTLDKSPTKKKNTWSFGPSLGFGLNTDVKGTNSRFGWNAGVSAGYNF